MSSWGPEAERLKGQISYAEMAVKFGVAKQTIKNYFYEKNKAHKEVGAALEQEIQQIKETALKQNEDRLKAQQLKELAARDIIADKMISAIKILPEIKIKTIAIPGKNQFSEEEVVLMLSDIQAGTYISREATGGLNEYNKDILKDQFEILKTSMTSIITRMKQITPIRVLNLHMLGDMIEGIDIFAGQAQHVDQDLYNQMFALADLLCEFIVEMLHLFERVKVKCVGGNHGRIGRKGENPHYVNHDVYLYKYIQTKLQNYKQIEFEIPLSWWLLTTIQGHNFLLLHGDDIKAWNGIPYYAIDRADAKWTMLLGANDLYYEYMEMGHFHAETELPRVRGEKLINGCWPGGSIFALKSLVTSGRPSQKLFGVHGDNGKTWSYNLFLDRKAG